MSYSKIGKFSEWYRHNILPYVKHLRGTTRLFKILEYLACKRITVKEEGVFQSILDGFKMSRRDDFRYYFREPEVVDVLKEQIDEETIFVDVGTFHGFFTLMAGSLGAQKIYSFELNEENFAELSDNQQKNNYSNIQIENLGVSKDKGEVSYIGKKNASKIGEGNKKAQITSLDKYFKNEKERKFLIKVDAEGAEKEILEGAEQFINNNNIDWIIEIHEGEKYGEKDHDTKEITQKMEEQGYLVEKLRKREEEQIIWAKKK